MILGVILKPDSCPEYLPIAPKLSTLQELVGGLITTVDYSNSISGYANDEGLLLDLPFNAFATYLFHRLNPEISYGEIGFVGTLVLFGPPDAEGNDTSLSDEALDKINSAYFAFCCSNPFKKI